MEEIFFKDWSNVGHVAIATVIAFITLFLFVRISGKRTLAKLNAFDFVVTVALGSTLSYMMLSLVPMLEGAVVLMLIIFLQYLFAWAARSSTKAEQLLNAVPRLLFYEGRFIGDAMEREALTEEEIYAAVRHAGIEHLEHVKAVVMELNGQISVIRKTDGSGKSTLDEFSEISPARFNTPAAERGNGKN